MNWRFGLTNTNNHVSTRELTQLPIADLETSVNRDLGSILIEEVKQFKPENSQKIEALVFALYGFSVQDTNDVLKMRLTPEKETDVIMDELKDLTY
jgi:hypothetical protein